MTFEPAADVLTCVLPQFEESVIKARVPSVVGVLFPRDTTYNDVKKLDPAPPKLRVAYLVDKGIIVTCSFPSAREAIQDELKSVVDPGKPVETKHFAQATSSSLPIDFS